MLLTQDGNVAFNAQHPQAPLGVLRRLAQSLATTMLTG
jgi:hypothetical protein